jgi:hypothetical protein
MGRYIQCIFVYFCIWRVAMAERVAQRHRTEANGDDPVAVIVINDPPAPAAEVKQEPLSTKALNALIKDDTCSLCGHKAGRTNKRVHITTKHPEITSDNHPLVIAKLAAALPNIMKSMASAPKAVSVQVRVMEFFAAHSIPHQIVESPYWRAMLLAIRTQGDMELCKSRKTFATKLDEHSSCKLQQALADRCGSCGYLSIDSGTVIHRYLGAERADRGKETRSKTMTCLKCSKHLTEHSNADSFSCKVCQRRCACECSGVHPAKWNDARTVYRCAECARS